MRRGGSFIFFFIENDLGNLKIWMLNKNYVFFRLSRRTLSIRIMLLLGALSFSKNLFSILLKEKLFYLTLSLLF